MKLINPSVAYIQQDYSVIGMFKQIELAGRTCYKSSNKITENSYKPFIDRLKNNKHYAVLEFGTVYLYKELTNINDEEHSLYKKYQENPYSKVKIIGNKLYITSNYRVLVENGWEDDLKYYQHTLDHENRYTFKIITDRGVSHELVRHRVFSFAQESTRFCNYSSNKFSNELTFIIPSWSLLTTDIKASDLCKISDTDKLLYYTFVSTEEDYIKLINHYNYTPQQARQILPNAVKTELFMCGFYEDWRHFLNLRLYGITGKPHPDMLVISEKINSLLKDNINKL